MRRHQTQAPHPTLKNSLPPLTPPGEVEKDEEEEGGCQAAPHGTTNRRKGHLEGGEGEMCVRMCARMCEDVFLCVCV